MCTHKYMPVSCVAHVQAVTTSGSNANGGGLPSLIPQPFGPLHNDYVSTVSPTLACVSTVLYASLCRYSRSKDS